MCEVCVESANIQSRVHLVHPYLRDKLTLSNQMVPVILAQHVTIRQPIVHSVPENAAHIEAAITSSFRQYIIDLFAFYNAFLRNALDIQ